MTDVLLHCLITFGSSFIGYCLVSFFMYLIKLIKNSPKRLQREQLKNQKKSKMKALENAYKLEKKLLKKGVENEKDKSR